MIISVAAHKGGVAKTTTAIHLAGYLQTRGKTLLVDYDVNESSLLWGARGLLPFSVCRNTEFAMKLTKDTEHVVFDYGVGPTIDDTKKLLKMCELVVIPTTAEILSVAACRLIADHIKEIGDGGNYRVVLTAVPPAPSKDLEQGRKLLKGLPLTKAYTRRFAAFRKAAAAGVLVGQVADRHAQDGASDYLSIAKEIIG